MSRRRVAIASTFVADGKRVEAAAGSPPAVEREVEREIEVVLMWLGCVRLSDFSEAVTLAHGTLVCIATASRKSIKATGIDTGMPDRWFARVGCWGWQGVEVKSRGNEGRCGGTVSVAQDTAQRSKLVEIVWCTQHLKELFARLDRQAGWTPTTRPPPPVITPPK